MHRNNVDEYVWANKKKTMNDKERKEMIVSE